MTSLSKILAIALVSLAGAFAVAGTASAGPDGNYHWAYPDDLKLHGSNAVQPSGSGIPAQYR
jgi:hypothetical protein